MKRRFEKVRVIEGPIKHGLKLRDKTGIFIVSIDPDALLENLERAATNKCRASYCGPLRVEYRPMTPSQLDAMRPLLSLENLTGNLTAENQVVENGGIA